MPNRLDSRFTFMLGCFLLLTYPGIRQGLAQDPNSSHQTEWPCGGDSHLFVDQDGVPVWIGFHELKQHAINAPLPTTPSPFRTSAHLVVDVLIDTAGHVTCVRIPSGHPTLKLAAARAALRWRFRPFVVGGHPAAAFGRLEFVFGSDNAGEARP